MTAELGGGAYVSMPLDPLCAIIEEAQRHGIYMGTPLWQALEHLPDEVNARLVERQNERTERILAAHKRCAGHKHSPTLGKTKCLFCDRFIPDAELRANDDDVPVSGAT